jgi:WD40 repeat protein
MSLQRRLIWPVFLLTPLLLEAIAIGQVPQIDDEPNNDKPFLALDTGGHTDAVYKLLVSEYTRQLISVGLDKTIRLWNLETGEPERVLRPPIANAAHGYLFSAAISPDGKLLAVGTYRALTPLHDHRIHLIDLASGQMIRSLKGHEYTIYDLAFSADGERLASASQDKTARIWNVSTGETLHVLKGHEAAVHGIAWSPDGNQIATGSLDNTARIWSSITGQSTAVMREAQDHINTVGWRPDGKVIAAGSKDKAIRLYDTAGKLIYQWPNLPNEVESLKFSSDSKRLLFTYGSNTEPPIGCQIMDMTTGKMVQRYSGHENSPISCTFIGDGQLAASGDTYSHIHLWDTTTGKTIRKLYGRGKSMLAAGWSPDGQAISWGTTMGELTLSTVNKLEHTFCLANLDFGPPPDNTFFQAKKQFGSWRAAIQAADRRKIFFLKDGAISTTYTLGQMYDQVRCFTFVPEDHAVVGSHDGAYLVNFTTGREEAHLSERGGMTWAVSPSPNSKYVLTAENDQVVRVWRMDTAKMLVALFVAGEEWIAWTPQGYYAASFAGERLMGWHINRSPEAMSDYYPATYFHKSLYRPDVIRRLLEAGDLSKAIELADRERNEQTQVIRLTDILPAEVKITAPSESRVETADGKVTIRATAQARENQTVTSMRLLIDGRPYGRATTGAEQSWDITLPPGKHTVAVKADTAKSFALSPPIEVTRPAAPSDSKAKLFILSAGGAADATAASSVAKAMNAAKPNEFGEAVTLTLIGDEATPEGIASKLESVRHQATAGDTTFIYLAGTESLDGAGRYQISSTDYGGAANSAPGLSEGELRRLLSGIQGRVILATDTRRSQQHSQRETTRGFCGAGDQSPMSKLDMAADEFFRELLSEDHGVVVMRSMPAGGAAGSSGSSSVLVKPGSSGTPFSQALTEGLSGKAEEDANGTIHFSELSRYLNGRVRELSGGKQSAATERPHGVPSFPIAQPK